MTVGFRVAARTMIHLGAELITSDAIALNELIKNSFDAASERVAVNFFISMDMKKISKILSDKDSNEAEININDLIASDAADDIHENICSRYFELISINSLHDTLKLLVNEYCFITIGDTGDGMSYEDIVDKFLVIGTDSKLDVKRSSKKNPLLGNKGIGRLSMMRLGDVAEVISSTKKDSFLNHVVFNWKEFYDPNKYIEDIEIEPYRGNKKDCKSKSGTQITIRKLNANWDRGAVEEFVDLYIRRLRDPLSKKRIKFPIDVLFNNDRLPAHPIDKWLRDEAHLEAKYTFTPNVKKPDSTILRRTLRFKGSESNIIRDWSVSELTHKHDITLEQLKRLGEFSASCLWYNRGRLQRPSIDINIPKFKKELDKWTGGFAIYRDGFRIGWTGGLHDDWLRMDESMLRKGSFAVNTIQTVGSLAISSEYNEHLVDAANREGIIEDSEFCLLRTIMQDEVIDDLRSEVAAFGESEEKARITEVTAEKSVADAEKLQKKTLKIASTLEKQVSQDLKPLARDIRTNIEQYGEHVSALNRAIELAQEQKINILELAGVGMSVDIVMHELARITARAQESLKSLTKLHTDPDTELVLESIHEQLKAANKRIKNIDPLSPAARQRKVKFDLTSFIRGILNGYKPRFENHTVGVFLYIDGEESNSEFPVTMVKGLIAHVFENLITNSMYWLKVGLESGSKKRNITVNIDTKSRTIEFRDNGPGIDPKHKERVFKPYFSQKKNGKGLGLYIARELTEYHKGKLYLDSAVNSDNRLTTFIIELP